jgi:predicted nucleic acid-binding protein
MSLIRTYIDADVIINALRVADISRCKIAYKILGDPNRRLLVSDYLRLETLPKSIYHHQQAQVDFINKIIEHSELIPSSATVINKAMDVASFYGLNGMDALHVASAFIGQADEMVSFEKPSKPFYRIPLSELRLISLHPEYYH